MRIISIPHFLYKINRRKKIALGMKPSQIEILVRQSFANRTKISMCQVDSSTTPRLSDLF